MTIAEKFPVARKPHTIAEAAHAGKRKSHGLFAAAVAACCALWLAGCATQPSAHVKDTSRSFTTVVIDPGHGGKDSGTWSKSRRGPHILEKNAALDVALRLDSKLRAAGFHTVMTRRSDVFIELNERAAISNRQQNAVFVSVHFNDSPRRVVQGAQTYYHSPASIPLAQKIEQSLDTIPGVSGRVVKYASFRVLKLNEYPAVLVECGFLSNKNEAMRCARADYRDQLAEKIADAVIAQRRSGSQTGVVAATTGVTSGAGN